MHATGGHGSHRNKQHESHHSEHPLEQNHLWVPFRCLPDSCSDTPDPLTTHSGTHSPATQTGHTEAQKNQPSSPLLGRSDKRCHAKGLHREWLGKGEPGGACRASPQASRHFWLAAVQSQTSKNIQSRVRGRHKGLPTNTARASRANKGPQGCSAASPHLQPSWQRLRLIYFTDCLQLKPPHYGDFYSIL